jgi:hypothetical protein
MIANLPITALLAMAKADLDGYAWPRSALESVDPPFWHAARALLRIGYQRAQADQIIPQEVFTSYPSEAVLELAIMGMKTELPTYNRGRPSLWALHNLAHTLLGLANVSKGKGYSLLNCAAVVPTLAQDGDSFLWETIGRFIHQQARSIIRGQHVDEDFILDVVQDAWLSVRLHLASFQNKGTFCAWIHRIVENKIMDVGRSLQRQHQRQVPAIETETELAQVFLRSSVDVALFPEIHAPLGIKYMMFDALLDFVIERYKHVPHHRWIKARCILRDFRGSGKEKIAQKMADELEICGTYVPLALFLELMERVAADIEDSLVLRKAE